MDLAPGTYVLYNAGFATNGGKVSVNCSACYTGGPGVTLVFTGSSASTVGTINIGSNATVQLNAPASGPYAGVVIYRDVLSSSSTWNYFSGGSSVDLSGAIYMPTSTLSMGGSTNMNTPNDCHVIVVGSLQMSGSSSMAQPTGCGVLNTVVAGQGSIRVLE
jgi:hypothetical protein